MSEVGQKTPVGGRVRRRFRSLADALAPTLAVATPFLVLVKFHYSYLRAEVLLLLLAFVALGVLCGVMMRRGSDAVRVMVMAVALALFLDFITDWGIKVLGIAFIGCLILSYVLRARLTAIAFWAFTAFVVGTLALPGPDPTWKEATYSSDLVGPSSDLPPIIHLVLDEHIGIEGIPTEIDGGGSLREELKAFYNRNGFRVFGKAFSQYNETYNSLSNMFNLTAEDVDHYYFDSQRRPFVLKENAYFRLLSEKGYRIRVYQSNYLDLCQGEHVNLEFCLTYSGSIKWIEDAELEMTEKMKLIGNSLMGSLAVLEGMRALYQGIREGLAGYGWSFPAWPDGIAHRGTLPVLSVLTRMRADIERVPRGTLFFAHLLIPHYPYVYDRSCQIRPKVADWLSRNSPEPLPPQVNTDTSRAERYARYFEQVRCQQRELQRLVDLVLATAGDDAIVIVHGDHGSRIARYWPLVTNAGRLSRQDYRDAYATLFAIRSPRVEAGYDPAPASLTGLLADLLPLLIDGRSSHGPVAVRSKDAPYVFLRGEPSGPMAPVPASELWER